MPTREGDFTSCLGQVLSLISASPSMYGLLTQRRRHHRRAERHLGRRLRLLTSDATKTAQAVQGKNIAKVAVTAQIRTFAQSNSE